LLGLKYKLKAVVGTMIGVDDEDEKPEERSVLGFATILNLKYYQVTLLVRE